MAGETVYFPAANADFAYDVVGSFQGTGDFDVGHLHPSNYLNGAIRFRNVTVAQGTSVNDAGVVIISANSPGDSYYFYVEGLDEDNTADFNASNAFGRSRTSARTTHYQSSVTDGQRYSYGAGSIVNEILARGGWSSGNAMGFVFIAEAASSHGGTSNFFDANLSTGCYLWIRTSAEPDFTPTPISLTSDAFPETDDYGIRLSKPGVDVKTATEHELYYTSRKRVMTVKQEGLVTTTANPHAISHGLSYTPMVMAFALSGGRRYQLPRVRYGSGGSIGYVSTTNTTVRFHINVGTQVYYYIFYDQQP